VAGPSYSDARNIDAVPSSGLERRRSRWLPQISALTAQRSQEQKKPRFGGGARGEQDTTNQYYITVAAKERAPDSPPGCPGLRRSSVGDERCSNGRVVGRGSLPPHHPRPKGGALAVTLGQQASGFRWPPAYFCHRRRSILADHRGRVGSAKAAANTAAFTFSGECM
jgi:hypothetical protein